MKTTNLFIDFIIIGFIGLLPIFPFISCIQEYYSFELSIITKNNSLSMAIIALSIYLIGVLYNQVSGYFVKILGCFKIIPRSSSLRKKMFSNFNYDYHEALQLVIAKSSDAYSYLSYRRSMVRIYRSLIFSTFLLLISVFLRYLRIDQTPSVLKLLYISIPLVLFSFSRLVYVKNIKGYYSSIINFYNVLNQND